MRIYYDNPYIYEWNAYIVNQIEKEGNYIVELSETAFYPEGGGQPRDFGWIDGIEVVDLFEENDKIYHVLKQKPEKINVYCKIDFERRFDHMQNHTGQHLLSAIFLEMYDAQTNSFHLGDDYLTIDIGLENINDEIIRSVENKVNELIFKNIPVKSYIVNKEAIKNLPLRKLPPTDVNIRIVEIEGVDYSPCCGTHVKNLGEIGMVKILKTEKYKNMTRIYFKCGKRLLRDFQEKTNIINNLIKSLSVPQHEIEIKMESLQNEVKNLTKQLNLIKELNAEYEAKELLKHADDKITKIFEDKSFEEIQLISYKLAPLKDILILFASTPDKKVLLSHNGNLAVNCGKLFKDNLSKFNGRGGGSPKFAQASFEKTEDIYKFIDFLKNQI